jgi:N-acetylmuramoyl-L-alanine amidase
MLDIMIDPGHGGSVAAGNSTPYGRPLASGRNEKDLNLALARSVHAALPGSRLTRGSDHNLPLATRAARASASDVFVSLHGAPAGSPPAVWVHPHAAEPARHLAARLARAIGATQVRTDAPMAVLNPERLSPGCAACLVEVDADGVQYGGVDAAGEAIAGAIRAYAGGATVQALNYFTDTEELTRYMRDQRAADTRRVSSVADAQAIVDAWARRGRPTVWSGLNATQVGSQIRDRCRNHRLIEQGNLNLCGPAAFIMCWAGRDPVAYARYAIGMLETGSGRIASRTVRASPTMRGLRYPRMGNPEAVLELPVTELRNASVSMTTPALRNDANAILPYDGRRSNEPLAGLTRPEELARWMTDAGTWTRVRNEANWARTRGYDHAMSLMPGGGEDIALLINVNALSAARRVRSLDNGGRANPFTPDSTFIANQFPNHFVVLLAEMVPDVRARTLSMSVWTWGGSYTFEGVPLQRFMENYYGAVRGSTRR